MTHLDAQHVNRTGIMIRGLIILLCAGIINATSVFITPLAAYYGWEASAIANIGDDHADLLAHRLHRRR